MSTIWVHQHLAEMAATDFIVQILAEQYENELNSLFNREDDYTGAAADVDDRFPRGVFLPPPDRYLRQLGPTPDQDQDLGWVRCYVASTGDAAFAGTGPSTVSVDGYIVQMRQPFVVSIVCSVSIGDDLQDPSQANSHLRDEEVTKYRASYYAGALVSTLSKYACRHVACEKTGFRARDSSATPIRIAQDRYGVVGIGVYEFDVYNHQLFPKFATLPT